MDAATQMIGTLNLGINYDHGDRYKRFCHHKKTYLIPHSYEAVSETLQH